MDIIEKEKQIGHATNNRHAVYAVIFVLCLAFLSMQQVGF